MYRFLLSCALLSVLLLSTPGCSVFGSGEEPKPFAVKRIRFESWQETCEVDLLKRTINRATTVYTYENEVSGTPTSSLTIPAPEEKLTPEEAAAVDAFILSSGILDLEKEYGAPADRRHYSYTMTVHRLEGPTKRVLFRSNPEYGKKPAAFLKVETFLRGLPQSAHGS